MLRSLALSLVLAVSGSFMVGACGPVSPDGDDGDGGDEGPGGKAGGNGSSDGAGVGGSSGDATSQAGENGAGQPGEGGSGPGRGSGGAAVQAGAGGGDAGEGGSDPGNEPAGDVPVELAGVWQQTRASAGEYTNGFGENFSITSGFSVQLKISPNGAYYFAHLASGASLSCGTVEYFDQSVGTAVLEGNTLTLYPTERRLDVVDCRTSGSQALSNDPIPLTIEFEETRHGYGGLRTYLMKVDGASHPLELTLLHRPPIAEPEQPAQPEDFVLGVASAEEFQGLWVAADGTDSNFFDPASGDFYFPKLNGSPHQWIRFAGSAYETAVALQYVNSEGACKTDLIYYEQGEALVHVLEDVGEQGKHFVGHTRLEATAAHLIVNIRECGGDDQVLRYDLPPQSSYYRWIFFTKDAPPERITLDCAFQLSEWQSMLCTNAQTGFYRRE